MRIDKAGHDDAAGCVNLRRAAGVQVRPDGTDLSALDQHVRLREVADLRIERHHRAASNNKASARPAAVHWRVIRRGRARCEEVEACSAEPRSRRTLQKITSRTEMPVPPSLVAQFAHLDVSPIVRIIRNKIALLGTSAMA